MTTLLKDMPEHMERIEGNSINAEIMDVLNEHSDWSETRGNNVVDEGDFELIIEAVKNKITEFVNQNYEWKGVKS